MLLLRLWNFLRGYVIINVNGYFIEKFINLSANKGIYLWGIKRKLHNNMILSISINGFKQLRGIAKKTRCHVKILKKVGLPFIKFRYRKRKTFFGGFIFFAILIYVLSSFIWVIEIKGIKDTSPQQIINFLDKNGIKPGIIKYNIDKEEIIPRMLIDIDQISWAEISVVGTKIVVNIVERVMQPPLIDRKTPCHIYAKKNAVIKNIITKNGTAKVRAGEVVRKGELLISGIVENALYPDNIRIVHSDGDIKGVTWYQEKMNINKVQIKRERTQEYKRGFGFKIFSNYYGLYRNRSPYKLYDLEENTKRLTLWKNFELPIEIVTKRYYEIKYNKYILTEEQAKEEVKNNLFKKLDEKIPKDIEIVDKKIEYDNIGDTIIKALATYECIEDIGYKQKIIQE